MRVIGPDAYRLAAWLADRWPFPPGGGPVGVDAWRALALVTLESHQRGEPVMYPRGAFAELLDVGLMSAHPSGPLVASTVCHTVVVRWRRPDVDAVALDWPPTPEALERLVAVDLERFTDDVTEAVSWG